MICISITFKRRVDVKHRKEIRMNGYEFQIVITTSDHDELARFLWPGKEDFSEFIKLGRFQVSKSADISNMLDTDKSKNAMVKLSALAHSAYQLMINNCYFMPPLEFDELFIEVLKK